MNRIKYQNGILYLFKMEIEWQKEILYKDLVKWEKRLEKETPFFKELLDSFNSKKLRILDVSCGTGFHLVMFAKWGYQGVGIDISEKNIEEAIKLAKNNNVDNKTDFIIGDILEIEKQLKDESFDFILFIGNTFSIFSAEERKSLLNQLIVLLNKGGKILIQAVNYLSHQEEKEWFYNPNIQRDRNGSLIFYNRIMEWKEPYDKITMYVHKIQQNTEDLEEFRLQTKRTEFYVPKKKDLEYLHSNEEFKISFFGDYKKSVFKEDKSNDIVILVEKN